MQSNAENSSKNLCVLPLRTSATLRLCVKIAFVHTGGGLRSLKLR